MAFWGWGASREWINWISFISKGACQSKTHPGPGTDIDLCYGYCYERVEWGMFVYIYLCIVGVKHTGLVLKRLLFFLVSRERILCNFVNSIPVRVQILYSKMPRAIALCSSALTVIHCGLPQGHWGWVSTQSELYIKPIGLIYSPNNSRLIKKRKGRGGI